ncbi:helix-turn-helix transcriptional regulator [Sphingopyxis sp. GC21]|uniref:helix-turn-helix transcriptional regulator n=1 Tax=Sphingopyxis sp. GC21 TaxID=2933562 RepID=UPI0021E42122|nr:AraC family transcriptional regulator [Sphingopyxis sp. GC21]
MTAMLAERMLNLVPRDYEIVEREDVGLTALIATRPQRMDAEGFRNVLIFPGGVTVSWASLHRLRDVQESEESDGALRIHIRMAGRSIITSASARSFEIEPRSCTVAISPAGVVRTQSFFSGDEERSVTVSCDKNYLIEYLGLDPSLYSGALSDYLNDVNGICGIISTDLSFELREAAAAFFEAAGAPFARCLLLQSRANDIIRIFFEQIVRRDARGSQPRSRDRLAVARVMKILEDRYQQPPPANEIARQAGMSLSKLSKLFKAVEGKTMMEYLLMVRMRRALDLMREGDLSITQISYEVGYEYPANFSTAFRRFFGTSPREALSQV